MARKVSFSPMSKEVAGQNAYSEILLDGEAVGAIEKNTEDTSSGFYRRIVVTDYTASFYSEGFPEKSYVFIVAMDPRKFAVEARRVQNQRKDDSIVYIGPYATSAKALSAAKEWVRETLKAA
jgi:hypothetical protein